MARIKPQRKIPPFGRLMLFFLITAALFGLFSLFRFLNPFFAFYTVIAVVSLMASAVCLVLWLIMTLFKPATLFAPGDSFINDNTFLDGLFCKVPYFRFALLSLVISLALFWIHSLVFPISFTVFLASITMGLARLLFFTYGSSGKY